MISGDFGALIVFISIVEYSIVAASLVGLVVLRLGGDWRKIWRHGQEGRELLEDGESNAMPRPELAPSTTTGTDSEGLRVSWFVIAVALTSYISIVAAAVAKHPLIGLGCLGFCVLSSCVHRYVVRKAVFLA